MCLATWDQPAPTATGIIPALFIREKMHDPSTA
jgi:hypothetical protein